MSAQNPLEKKLDRYYEDIIDKIMELIETQKNLLGEQKELKKDIAKLKEHVLESHADIKQIDTKIDNLTKVIGSGGGASKGGSFSSNSYQSNSSGTTRVPSAKPSGGSPKSLKDFLATEAAIFDVKVLNAFIKSTKEIVKTNTRTEPSFLKPVVGEDVHLQIVVAGRMQLARDSGKGTMAFCMELLSAQAITRAVFMLPEDGKVSDADIKDVTSEICNQICGKSKLALKNEGYSFDIGIPEIHQGVPKDLIAVLGLPKISLFFAYNKLPFYVLFWG
ncbi:chemotaxis protein CheX [Silvanigrella sp.]|jgi:CheY-specific phosphatase CheX|uniref:chemotaxis protein CheX n=1 Tax=Silvanigrella sp. TaxID=2024976 RepID=UPI0037C4F650|nr:chemotaxis protein CheX [Silvanigrellaceae bacterium]